MSLYLPERTAIAIENARREKLVDETVGRAKAFFYQLQEYDPNMDLVLAHEGAHEDDPRLLDGFWHVRRLNQGINDSYMPITTPEGEWAEPSDYHLNQLRERDMWRDGGIDAIYQRIRAREAELERKAADARAAKRDELAGHYKSIDSPGVSFSSVPWTARTGARRG